MWWNSITEFLESLLLDFLFDFFKLNVMLILWIRQLSVENYVTNDFLHTFIVVLLYQLSRDKLKIKIESNYCKKCSIEMFRNDTQMISMGLYAIGFQTTAIFVQIIHQPQPALYLWYWLIHSNLVVCHVTTHSASYLQSKS